jgi:CDP-paratose 2-epimerase
MKLILVTGSSGLIGSAVVEHFNTLGWMVIGLDNNMRADFFGAGGDTSANRQRLRAQCANFLDIDLDIRDRNRVLNLVERLAPDLIVHTAAQPSHDLAARRVFDDFEVNAGGTLNLLEAAHKVDAVFVHLSTNKVYGDAPNELQFTELETRYDYADGRGGIDETMRIDQSKHSLFGASKLAADVLVQEYGRYFGQKTCALRCGCLTGGQHAGVELHGFLSYLVKTNVSGELYKVYGYKGKQVRDNLHARDVARFVECFYAKPRSGEVYNLGGGRANSVSVLEAFARIEAISGKAMRYEYGAQARAGDHICYISDLSKVQQHYPDWSVSVSLDDIFLDLHRSAVC